MFKLQKQFLHCVVQLIILRIEAAQYLLLHWISQRHSILLIVINSGIPKWILNVIINWYSKPSVVVRWKTALCRPHYLLYLPTCLLSKCELNAGCGVNGTFVGCIIYADDLVVLSASVSSLQSLLDCCYQVSIILMLKLNCLKSSCSVVGSASKLNISEMQRWSLSI